MIKKIITLVFLSVTMIFSLIACDIPDPLHVDDDTVCLKYYNTEMRVLYSMYTGGNIGYTYTVLSPTGNKEVLRESLIIYCE